MKRPHSVNPKKRRSEIIKRKSKVNNEPSQDLISSKQKQHLTKSMIKKELQTINNGSHSSHLNERKKFDVDILTLKHNLNICREENIRLKDQIHKAQKEMEYKNLYIKELLGNKRPQTSLKHDAPGLNSYIKELDTELEKLKKENSKLLKSGKYIKISEVKTELNVSMEEVKRLRKMLDDTLTSQIGDSPGAKQKIEAKKMKLENIELLKIVQKQEAELVKLKENTKKTQTKKKFKTTTLRKRKSEQSTGKIRPNPQLEDELKLVKENINKRYLYYNY